MGLINNLRKQVDIPVWEWCRFSPLASAAASCSAVADNSNFHVNHGRYIYYLVTSVSFWRYDTWTDTYLQLASAPITQLTWGSLRFLGSRGYDGRVISATSNTITAAGIFGNVLKSYDIRINFGTGMGQRRIITSVADVVVADSGTATAGSTVALIIDSTKAWQFNQWVGYQVRVVLSTGVSQVRKIMYNNATTLTVEDVNQSAQDTNYNAPFSTAPVTGSAYQIESSVITVDSAWATTPDSTSRFTVESGGIYFATSSATTFYALMYYDVIADTWYTKTANTGPMGITGTDGTITCMTENASIWDRGNVGATAGSGASTLTDTTKNWTVNAWAGYYVRIFTGTGEGDLQVIASNTSTILTISGTWGGSGIDVTSKYLIVGYDAGTASSAGAESQTASGTTSTISGNLLTVGGSISGTFIPGQLLSGTGVGAPVLFSGAQTSAAAVVTVASTTNVQVGMVMNMISGTGTLLAATVSTVISVNSNTTFTISATPSVALAGSNVFILSGGVSGGGAVYISASGATNSSTTVTVGTTASLFVGMAVIVTSGTGTFYAGTTVTAINSTTTFTVSTAPSVNLSASAVVAGAWPFQTILGTQVSGTVGGAGVYNVYPPQIVASTTITGTGVATLTDSTKTWATNRWNNMLVRITFGTGKGQTRSIQGTYQTSGGGVISVVPNWATTPDNTSVYEIQGDTDKLYMQLGANISTGIYNAAADTMTLGRMEDYGNTSSLAAQFADYLPVAITSGTFAGTTMTVTTIQNHNFKTGQTIRHAGDTGAGASYNNISATITVTSLTTYTYTVSASSATMVGSPAQSTTNLTDSSKNWIPNQFAGSIVTYNTTIPVQATGLATAMSAYVIGNTSTTLYFAFAATTTPTAGTSRYVITAARQLPFKNCVGIMDGGLAVGTQSAAVLTDATKSWTSAAANCTSSGSTITLGTGTTAGLQVGMYVAVLSGTGAFVIGGGTAITSVQVATIASSTTFTVTSVPTTTLSAASVTATFWPTNAFVNRKVRIIAGTGQYQEIVITANTSNTLSVAFATAPVTGASAYSILQANIKGVGIEMEWAFGASDTTRRGSYLYCPRGGATLGWDRLNTQIDSWDLMSTSPQFEVLGAGSMYAYDGVDRIYFTKDATQRVYYLDIDKSTIHGAGMYPYTVPGVLLGNRFAIFTTVDGLKYLWINKNTAVECFKQLLFY